jgi:hypothetical protein
MTYLYRLPKNVVKNHANVAREAVYGPKEAGFDWQNII